MVHKARRSDQLSLQFSCISKTRFTHFKNLLPLQPSHARNHVLSHAQSRVLNHAQNRVLRHAQSRVLRRARLHALNHAQNRVVSHFPGVIIASFTTKPCSEPSTTEAPATECDTTMRSVYCQLRAIVEMIETEQPELVG
ncbi:hypothetical protein CRM22_009621 [Opisthorchis felineus]|uniref:Uncharacterized protein n=1 Tax=Opisthorchis felineus TaxID=147828 RepID=A0A4S2L6X2_OPIFE|nr:hypothetical protein CRM22_009621 [Opisthorchis felineus]